MTAGDAGRSGWAAKAVPVLVLAGACAYANSFTKAFQFDDDPWIVNNTRLVTDPLAAITARERPLVMVTIIVRAVDH